MDFIELNRPQRGHPFLPDYIADIPALYSGEAIPMLDKIVWARYFIGQSQWWVIEYDPEDHLCFGFACLNDNDQDAEFGNFSLFEMETIKMSVPIHIGGTTHAFEHFIERDLDWEPKSIGNGGLPSRFYRAWWEK